MELKLLTRLVNSESGYCVRVELHVYPRTVVTSSSPWNVTCSRHDILVAEKIAHLALNNNHSLLSLVVSLIPLAVMTFLSPMSPYHINLSKISFPIYLICHYVNRVVVTCVVTNINCWENIFVRFGQCFGK